MGKMHNRTRGATGGARNARETFENAGRGKRKYGHKPPYEDREQGNAAINDAELYLTTHPLFQYQAHISMRFTSLLHLHESAQ